MPIPDCATITRRLQVERKNVREMSSRAPSSKGQRLRGDTGLLTIGASTGGPRALEIVLAALPAEFPWPVMVAQHMPAPFTKSFAERLNNVCALTVVEAGSALPLEAGTVYIGRGGADTIVANRVAGSL